MDGINPVSPMASRPGPAALPHAAHAGRRSSGGFGPWSGPRPGVIEECWFPMGITGAIVGIYYIVLCSWNLLWEYDGNLMGYFVGHPPWGTHGTSIRRNSTGILFRKMME